MISDAMNRSIPSVDESTRELWFAIGGPWCASAWAAHQTGCLLGALGDDDVLDRHPLSLVQALDEVAPQPARALLGREGRDDDLVDPLVVDGLHRRRVRIRVRDLAVRVDPLAAEHRECAPQPPLGFRMRRPGSGRSAGSTIRKLAGRARRALPDARRAAGRRRRVSFAITSTFALTASSADVDDDVLDGQAPGRLADAVDHVPPQPARASPSGASRR